MTADEDFEGKLVDHFSSFQDLRVGDHQRAVINHRRSFGDLGALSFRIAMAATVIGVVAIPIWRGQSTVETSTTASTQMEVHTSPTEEEPRVTTSMSSQPWPVDVTFAAVRLSIDSAPLALTPDELDSIRLERTEGDRVQFGGLGCPLGQGTASFENDMFVPVSMGVLAIFCAPSNPSAFSQLAELLNGESSYSVEDGVLTLRNGAIELDLQPVSSG